MGLITEQHSTSAKVCLSDILGILTVFCFAVLPDAYNAVVIWFGWVDGPSEFFYVIPALIIRSIQLSAPVLLIVYLSQTSWSSIGILPIRWIHDLLWGLVIWLIGTFAYVATCNLLPLSAYSTADAPVVFEKPEGLLGISFLLKGSCANGFAEELVIRGYLLTHIERVLGSVLAAVVITSMLFASYHLYQGLGAMIGIAVLGIVYGTAFCIGRRQWPLVVAHAIADFTTWLAA